MNRNVAAYCRYIGLVSLVVCLPDIAGPRHRYEAAAACATALRHAADAAPKRPRNALDVSTTTRRGRRPDLTIAGIPRMRIFKKMWCRNVRSAREMRGEM